MGLNKDQKRMLQKALEKLNLTNAKPVTTESVKTNEIISDMLNGAARGGDSPNQEDVDMLRQVLDNLLTFSFNQESF